MGKIQKIWNMKNAKSAESVKNVENVKSRKGLEPSTSLAFFYKITGFYLLT